VTGHLVSLLTLMKSQPLAYNKDNQEDKEPLFDALDTLRGSLRAFSDLVPNLNVNREAMHASAKQGYATATDLADYLVNKGLPFRDAHEVVGSAVAYAIQKGKDLSEFTLQEMHAFDRRIEADVFDNLSLEGSVAARDMTGGTAPNQVRRQIADCRKLIKQSKKSKAGN
jgi:argininosuccinate lyase